ncbi:hypothetical protein SAMN04487939_12244 [Lysobacter sp. yr284]|uniref:hypothetical protein n=1 Tax=Lysobacter sp. yr284 TaxID=1761791 RepID=UPI0008970CE1|nr:hypothetical protein [Lysobacter sp. yr284]SDZ20252.1 hypothetical protein SAMN04487939_12244 [Lysobacter sp. yr284]
MKNANPHAGPDELLATLDACILDIVEGTLSNDEGSTDAEIAQYLMDLGLSEAQAKRAICYRALYTLNLWVGDYTPIRSSVALRYNGETGQFEIA